MVQRSNFLIYGELSCFFAEKIVSKLLNFYGIKEKRRNENIIISSMLRSNCVITLMKRAAPAPLTYPLFILLKDIY
jgi:hypothetical protein